MTIVCSQEEEDSNQMFLTQTPSCSSMEVESEGNSDSFLGLLTGDFSSPCVSLRENGQQYSDISDMDDDFTDLQLR